jgi:quinol-cytochrome oxidoreductase complex cytochrome b subunit
VRTAVRACLGLLAISFVVLTATGAWLWFRYQPAVGWIGDVHRAAAIAFVVIAVVAVVLTIIRRVRDDARGPLASVAVLVAAVATAVVGKLLLWDQLALNAVTVGSGTAGARAAFGPAVKFIIIDGREVAPSTFEFWAYAHLGLAVLVAGALVLFWLRTKERRQVPEDTTVRSS